MEVLLGDGPGFFGPGVGGGFDGKEPAREPFPCLRMWFMECGVILLIDYGFRHHHVESVHVKTSRGEPLHPALGGGADAWKGVFCFEG